MAGRGAGISCVSPRMASYVCYLRGQAPRVECNSTWCVVTPRAGRFSAAAESNWDGLGIVLETAAGWAVYGQHGHAAMICCDARDAGGSAEMPDWPARHSACGEVIAQLCSAAPCTPSSCCMHTAHTRHRATTDDHAAAPHAQKEHRSSSPIAASPARRAVSKRDGRATQHSLQHAPCTGHAALPPLYPSVCLYTRALALHNLVHTAKSSGGHGGQSFACLRCKSVCRQRLPACPSVVYAAYLTGCQPCRSKYTCAHMCMRRRCGACQ